MKVLLSWIREFVDVPESAEDIGKLMSVRGLALEGLEPHGDDVVMDFEVTANRPDCLSTIGIAREIATAYKLPLRSEGDGFSRRRHPAGAEAPALRTSADVIPVTIDDPDLCGRYVGAVADVTVDANGLRAATVAAKVLAHLRDVEACSEHLPRD